MEYTDLYYTETDELDYRRFLMLRPGAEKPSTSTEALNVGNKDNSSSTASESIFKDDKSPKRRRILASLEPEDTNVVGATAVTTKSQTYGKRELISKENKSCNSLAKISEENKETRKILVRLTEEVIVLKKEIQKLRESATKTRLVEILPKFPFKEAEEFAEMEKKVQDNESCFSQLKEEFLSVGSRPNPEQFVRDALKIIFTDELATKYTWLGTKQKKVCALLMLFWPLKVRSKSNSIVQMAFWRMLQRSIFTMQQIAFLKGAPDNRRRILHQLHILQHH